MTIVQALGAFLLAAMGVAALYVTFKPGSIAGNVVDSFGSATAGIIKASTGQA
jgi:hypothetical protein